MARVQIYTTDYCTYCTAAKRLFQRKNVAFEEVDVTHDHEKRDWLVKTTGQRTVPQIFIEGEPYGGFSDVSALDQKGELDKLLSK